MVVEGGLEGRDICAAAEAAVILLDTHAAIWIAQKDRRVRALQRFPRIYLSPASVLEIQFLLDAGRIRLSEGRSASMLAGDGCAQPATSKAAPVALNSALTICGKFVRSQMPNLISISISAWS